MNKLDNVRICIVLVFLKPEHVEEDGVCIYGQVPEKEKLIDLFGY